MRAQAFLAAAALFAVRAACAADAGLAVAPADRLAMADRLFNRGVYADARVEYAALKGDAAVAADEVLYRLAECDRALGRTNEAHKAYVELLQAHPASRHADRARLMRALLGPEADRAAALKVLDSDRVEASVRAVALYHLGILKNDADAFARCVRCDPRGRYAAYAKLRGASLLAHGASADDRRKAVALFLEIAFDRSETNRLLAEEALYLAAATSYGVKRYDEAGSLFRRYLKQYPTGSRTDEARRVCAWCLYLTAKYADVIALCDALASDDAAYLTAAATQAMGEAAKAQALFRKYLSDYPQGRYRREAELPLARLDFDAAQKAGERARTVEAAKRAAALSSSSADRLRLAWAYEAAGQAAEAEREYLAVAEKFPGVPEAAEALYRKAMADLRAEKWSAAEMALREALAGPLDARRRGEALYWRGIAAARLGHEAEGAAFLQKALATETLSLDQRREARIVLADTAWNAGRTDEAKAAYAELVREGATERMTPAKIRSVGQVLGGETAKACGRALAKSASAEWRQIGFEMLGAAEECATNCVAAAEAYARAVSEKCATEVLPRATWRLGVLQSRGGDLAKAEATLKKAIALNAANVEARAEAYLCLAQIAAARHDYRNARAYATVVTTLFEKSSYAADAAEILRRHPGEEGE